MANIARVTFQQLLEDCPKYKKNVRDTLKGAQQKKRRPKVDIPILAVGMEDRGSLELDVVIEGCLVKKVPIDSGSGVNLMTEETTYGLGFKEFEPTRKILRMADQSRRLPAGQLRKVPTVIRGVTFLLDYMVLRPFSQVGYNVLIGRPWLYGAWVKTDWSHQKLRFWDSKVPATRKNRTTMTWGHPPHGGETSNTDEGYTSEESSVYDPVSESEVKTSFTSCLPAVNYVELEDMEEVREPTPTDERLYQEEADMKVVEEFLRTWTVETTQGGCPKEVAPEVQVNHLDFETSDYADYEEWMTAFQEEEERGLAQGDSTLVADTPTDDKVSEWEGMLRGHPLIEDYPDGYVLSDEEEFPEENERGGSALHEEEGFPFAELFEEAEFPPADLSDQDEAAEEADDEASDSDEEKSLEELMAEYGDFPDLCRKVVLLVKLRSILLTKMRQRKRKSTPLLLARNRGPSDEDRSSGSWLATGNWRRVPGRQGKATKEGAADVLEVGVAEGAHLRTRQPPKGERKASFKAGARRREHGKRSSESSSPTCLDATTSETFGGAESADKQPREENDTADDEDDER